MKNKGFTLVELITTFALAAVIITILVNIVLIIKDIYVKYEIKTEMLIKQGELNSVVNDAIENGKVSSCSISGNEYTFTMLDSSTHTLTISSDTITFDDYVYKAGNNVTIDMTDLPSSCTIIDMKQIKVPISHKLYPDEDFGLNLVYIN